MPDFDTRQPQRTFEDRLRRLLAASAHLIASVAKALRRYVVADWFRSALIGGILFALIAIPLGVRFYTPSSLAERCDDGQVASLQQGPGPVMKPEDQGIESSEVTDPILSPNGEWLLYSKDQSFFVMKADGSCGYKLMTSEIYEEPVWSDDSKKITFLAPSMGGPSLFVINADGSGGPRRVDGEIPDYY